MMKCLRDDGISNIVVIGDTHCGSSIGLLPPRVPLDEGPAIPQNRTQKWLWSCWKDFWSWIYRTLAGAPFALVHIGDQIDGRHHSTTQLVSGNLSVQAAIAIAAFRPIVERAAKSFFIRGTEAHVGPSAETEEMIAHRLLGVINPGEPATTWDLWIELGPELIHFAHHISQTMSHAYKSSPLMRLMAASFAAAGEHHFRPPSMMIRGHCHDYTEVKRAHCRVITCPCWQSKTSYTWRFSTIEPVAVGGLLIRKGREGVYVRERIYTEPRPRRICL